MRDSFQLLCVDRTVVDNATFAKDWIAKEGYLMRTLRDVGSEAEEQVNEKRSNGSSIEGKVGQQNTAQTISSPRNELLLNAMKTSAMIRSKIRTIVALRDSDFSINYCIVQFGID